MEFVIIGSGTNTIECGRADVQMREPPFVTSDEGARDADNIIIPCDLELVGSDREREKIDKITVGI